MNSCLLSTGSEAGVTASATAHHRYSTPDLLYVRQDTHAALLAEQPEAVYFLATLIPVNWRIVDCPRQDALYRQWHPTVRASAANLCCEKTKLVVFLCSRRQSTPCRSSYPPAQESLGPLQTEGSTQTTATLHMCPSYQQTQKRPRQPTSG